MREIIGAREIVIENGAKCHIVLTKINRPEVNSRWIERPRLHAALNKGRKKKLTLISAPPGYGKSTLAVQWLDYISQPSAWLSLDENDSDLDRFLRYLLASIRKTFPQFGTQLEPLLASTKLPPPEYLADVLISELTLLDGKLMLALDDYHTITSTTVQVMITRLVEYLPENLHLIILTREDPPLPLPRWRIQQWLSELHAVDLRFLTEEAYAFFAKNMGEKLSSDTINQIVGRTEGWVTGLHIARLSLNEVENPDALARNFISSDGRIVDYLLEEVVSRQSEEIKDFLAVTSLLERFCAPLCDHVWANSRHILGSGGYIDYLEKKNLFLIPLDENRFWHRYHHLFQTMLIRQMSGQFSKIQQGLIHRKAGEWFAEQGYIEDALRHLIIAGDLDAASDLVEDQMHTAIDRDLSRRDLTRWLDLFPAGAEKKRPALLVAHSFQRLFNWDLAGIPPLLDRAESLLKESDFANPEARRKSLLGDIAIQRAVCLAWLPDPQNGLSHARQGLQLVPKRHRYAHATAIAYTAACMFLVGKKDDALLLLDKALTDDCAAGSFSAGHLLTTKAALFSYGANWEAVEASAKSILAIHKTVPQADYWLGYAHFFLGSAAYEHNQLDNAAEHFKTVQKMRYLVTTRVYHDALLGLALVAIVEGDAKRVEKYRAAASSFAIETKDPFSKQMSDWFEIRQAISSGTAAIAQEPHRSTDDSTQFWLLYPSLTQAEYLLHTVDKGVWSEALDCIETGLQMARYHHNIRLEIQFLAVKTLALKCSGRHDAALALLEKLLSLAEPFRLVRSFLDRGPLMAELLRLILAKRPGIQYAKALLDSFENQTLPGRSAASSTHLSVLNKQLVKAYNSSGLTNREIEVLHLLYERLSDKEIAETLFISITTVKSHTTSIYRKLDVTNRRLAVGKALQLGLLTPKG